MPRWPSLVLVLLLPLAACGESLSTRVERAMAGCVAQRNPLFVAGKGADAIATPLSAEVTAIAEKLNYERAFRTVKHVAEKAGTQAHLTCALELAARYRSAKTRAWLERYMKHRSPEVAAAAAGLVGKYQ